MKKQRRQANTNAVLLGSTADAQKSNQTFTKKTSLTSYGGSGFRFNGKTKSLKDVLQLGAPSNSSTTLKTARIAPNKTSTPFLTALDKNLDELPQHRDSAQPSQAAKHPVHINCTDDLIKVKLRETEYSAQQQRQSVVLEQKI